MMYKLKYFVKFIYMKKTEFQFHQCFKKVYVILLRMCTFDFSQLMMLRIKGRIKAFNTLQPKKKKRKQKTKNKTKQNKNSQ